MLAKKLSDNSKFFKWYNKNKNKIKMVKIINKNINNKYTIIVYYRKVE